MGHYLYGLAITKGMPSMGRGKSVAHAGAHAANLFSFDHFIVPLRDGKVVDPEVIAWHDQAAGFGTTVILDAGTEDNVVEIVRAIKVNGQYAKGICAGLVIDTTYPYFTDVELLKLIDPTIHTADPVIMDDRRVLCHRKQITAAYVFGEKEALAPFLGNLELLSNDPLPKSR